MKKTALLLGFFALSNFVNAQLTTSKIIVEETNNLTLISGKTGIGLTTPEAMLEIKSSETIGGKWNPASSSLKLTDGTNSLILGNNEIYSSAPLHFGSKSGNIAKFQTITNNSSTDRMVIQSDGKVGIGTTEPKEKLHVSGGAMIQSYSPLLKLRRDTDIGGFIQGVQTQYKNGEANFYFGNLHSEQWIISKGEYNGTRLFTVKSNGDAALSGKLEVKEINVSGDATLKGKFETTKMFVDGDATIQAYSPLLKLKRNTSTGGFIQGIQTQYENGDPNFYFGNLHGEQWIISKGEYNGTRLFTVRSNGDATLGGKLDAKEFNVIPQTTADFVFEENYDLPTLDFIENHIKQNKHLPEIASANEMKKNGVNIGEFQMKLLQKIEELTLYTIEQEKKIQAVEKENQSLKTINSKLLELQNRLEKLEQKN